MSRKPIYRKTVHLYFVDAEEMTKTLSRLQEKRTLEMIDGQPNSIRCRTDRENTISIAFEQSTPIDFVKSRSALVKECKLNGSHIVMGDITDFKSDGRKDLFVIFDPEQYPLLNPTGVQEYYKKKNKLKI